MDIVAFTDEHLDGAAAVLAERHAAHLAVEPLLRAPARLPRRRSSGSARTRTGAAGVEGGEVVGYLLGPRREDQLGPHVWSYVAGHAVREPELVRDLYAAAAERWVGGRADAPLRLRAGDARARRAVAAALVRHLGRPAATETRPGLPLAGTGVAVRRQHAGGHAGRGRVRPRSSGSISRVAELLRHDHRRRPGVPRRLGEPARGARAHALRRRAATAHRRAPAPLPPARGRPARAGEEHRHRQRARPSRARAARGPAWR